MTQFYNRQMPEAQGFFDPTMPGPNIAAGARDLISRIIEQQRYQDAQKVQEEKLKQSQESIDIDRMRAKAYMEYAKAQGLPVPKKMTSLEEKIWYRVNVLQEDPQEAVKSVLGDKTDELTPWQKIQQDRQEREDITQEKEKWIKDIDDTIGDVDKIIKDMRSPMSASEIMSYQLMGQAIPPFRIDKTQIENYKKTRDDLARIKAKFRAGEETKHDKEIIKQISSQLQQIGETGTSWRPGVLQEKTIKEVEKKILGAMSAREAAKAYGKDVDVFRHPDGYNYIDTPSGRIIITEK